jgi:carboxyl-terminal processing protease
MNKKISVGVAISLIAIACTVTFVVTWTVSFNMYNDMIPVGRRDEINSKIQEIDAFIQNNFLFLDEIDEERVAFGIFSGYISGVGDKNTVYMTAEEFINRRNLEEGQLVTCGIKAEREGSDYIKVIEVYPGSSAESQGILKDDIITFIDGQAVLEMGQDTAIRFLVGEENTRVDVTIQREGEETTHTLARQAIEIVSVESEIEDNVGFVRISTFSTLTAAQFDAALQELAQENIRALVIDVRGSSSGVYSSVTDMVNRLIGANTVAFTEHRGGIRRPFLSTDDSRVFVGDIPIVVLVDSGTNGAGELLAASLKSFGNAQLVGTNTAGNAYYQQTQVLKDGSAIRVTVARIVLASGLEYANVGLVPDYTVEITGETSESDPQIIKALEIIDTVTAN